MSKQSKGGTAWGSAIAGVLALAAAAAVYWYGIRDAGDDGSGAPTTAVTPGDAIATVDDGDPAVQYPVPPQDTADEATLPSVDASDPPLLDALRGLFGSEPVDSILIPDDLLRRLVVMADNLDKTPIDPRLRPVRPVPGRLVVEAQGDAVVLGRDNAQRYAPYVRALTAVDADAVVDLYFHYYPLFQRAYEDLGYRDRYFNDRVVELIDHLLATPEPEGPVALVRPRVLYQFADPSLEERSWGQKLLLRLGPEQEAIVKRRLSELRQAIVARSAEVPAR